MQFLTSLFGGSENEFLTAALALGLVLVLIVLALWVLKVFSRASGKLGGRSRRLGVVDSVMVDTRRRLIIVRRDNVEHLILTGGPQDVVVEAGIPVEKPSTALRRGIQDSVPPPPAEHAPSYPVGDAAQAAKSISPRAAADSDDMDRLRELGRQGDQRRWNSLRHTGLLRPVSRMVPAAVIPMKPDNSDNRRIDSATNGAGDGARGQGNPVGGKHTGDGPKAENI